MQVRRAFSLADAAGTSSRARCASTALSCSATRTTGSATLSSTFSSQRSGATPLLKCLGGSAGRG